MSEQQKFQENSSDISVTEGREESYLNVILARQARINLAHNVTMGIGGAACVLFMTYNALKKNRKMIEDKWHITLPLPMDDAAVQKHDAVKYPSRKLSAPAINSN